MKRLDSKRNRIILTALILFVTVIVSAVISFSTEIELEYTKSLVEQLYDELLVRDDRLINSDVYLVTDGYISRIKPNTSVEEFKDNFNRNDFVILEGDKEVSEGIIKSGMEVVRDDEHYNLVVAGDLNKDGLMNYVDTSIMINNTKSLTDDELVRKANDFNEDSKYDKTDVLNSVDYILDDKIELKEISKVKTPVIEFVSGVEGARDWFLNDIKLKFNATEDLEIGYKIIGSVDEVGIVDDGYEVTLSGYGAYKVIAWHIGKEGNRSDATSLVYKIDDREIEASITYSSTEIGSERVIAAISFNKENVFITNNDGKYTHTFYGNDLFDFEYEDLTGRTGRAHAEVSWVTDAIGEDGAWRYSVLNDEEIYLRERLNQNISTMGNDGGSDWYIPAEYDGYTVVGVGNNIYGKNIFGVNVYEIDADTNGVGIGINKLHFSDTLKEIGDYAFFGIHEYAQTGIVIPDSVERIGDYAFANGSFNDAIFFSSKSYGNIYLSSNLKYIGYGAFSYNGFNGNLVIPNSVVSIGDRAFENNLFDGELKLSEELTYIGEAAFYNNKFSGNLEIPSKVTEISMQAFEDAGFDGNLILNDGLSYISSNAFAYNSFTGDLIIPKSVEYIYSYGFADSGFSGSLHLGENLKYIGDNAFTNDRFTGDLVIPDEVTEIGNFAFTYNYFDGLLQLNDNIETIGECAFDGANFTNVDLIIPDSMKTIGPSAFSNTGIEGKLVIGENVTNIMNNAFSNNAFNGDLVIPDSVVEIGSSAFMGNNFDGQLTLGNSVKRIDDFVFYGNPFVGDLVLPDSLEYIGGTSFTGTSFDGDLIIGDKITNLNVIKNISGLDLTKFTGDLVIGDGITEVPDEFFNNTHFSGTLTLGNSIRTIGTDAFYRAGFTGNLVIPDSVEEIWTGAFMYTGFDGTLTLGKGLKVIDGSAFAFNTFTGDLVIPDSVINLGAGAFEGAGFDGILTIGNGIEYIPWGAFQGNYFTGDLSIPSSVTIIGYAAFADGTWDGNLYIPDSVSVISGCAFANNPNLKGTVDTSKFTTFELNAFEATPNVTIINYEG